LNDSIFLNPSFGSFLPTYSMALNLTRPTPGRLYDVSIQDGSNALFEGGLAYTVRDDLTFYHVGAAKSFIKRTGFGIGGKFFQDKTRHTSGQDLTFSVSGVPTDWFQTALVVDNVLETDEGARHGLYREYTLGTKFNVMGIVIAYLDPHYTPSLDSGKFGHEIGLEFILMKDLFLRFGNFRNSNIPWLAVRGRGYSTGLGWLSPRMSVDYALSRVLEPRVDTAHTFSITLYF
jgi:hypothetical protein